MFRAAPNNGLVLQRARVRGSIDGIAARRRLESALAGVSGAAIGVPPRALLIVRRSAPGARLQPSATGRDAFARAVCADLERTARRARRPWLDPDAATAPAVLFTDETELMACLLRDWLRGARAWWWQAILAGMTVPLWWRKVVIPRGDLLPAVLMHLATQREAIVWVERLGHEEIAHALASITAAHALSAPPGTAVSRRPLQDGEGDADSEPPSPRWRAAATAARERLIALVPELQTATLSPPQRRLLVLALGLHRAPAWTYSRTFAAALQSLDSAPFTIARDSMRFVRDPDAVPADEEEGRTADSRFPTASAPRTRNTAMSGNAVPVHGSPEPSWAKGSAGARATAPLSPIRARAPWMPGATARGPEPTDPTRPSAPSVGADAATAPSCDVGTRFGGVFYLLNVALALGLYGDFTQPRAPGIRLSPWDWLALVGRAWFGREFVRDPVWTLLAALAGRPPCQPPGHDFAAPRRWRVPADWLAPWGAVTDLKVYRTRTRLQLWHRAGFVAVDVPCRRGNGLAQATALCGLDDALRTARLKRMRRPPPRRVTCVSERPLLACWIGWITPYLEARLARALGAERSADIAAHVCRHPARIRCTGTHLDIDLSLATLPLALRVAGLDRDPGWIPAAGRHVAFHFE